MTNQPRLSLADIFSTRAKKLPPPIYGPSSDDSASVVDFVYGLADPRAFPTDAIERAVSDVLREAPDDALNYGPSYVGLRECVADILRARGVEAEADHVLITYGSSQVLGLLPQIFVDPGDVVIVEGPTFMGAVRHFANGGARLVTVPVDADGLDVDALEQILRDLRSQNIRPRFIYTIPTFQNPTGTTLPLARRQRLVALAAEYGVVVVEDDAYGELRFEGAPLPALAALDSEGWVLNVGTFSKILAPGVRLGWAYGNPEIVRRLEMLKYEGGSGPFLTRMVAQFAAEGRLEAHIKTLSALYAHKRDVMMDAIEKHLPTGIQPVRPEGGFFLWCNLPEGMSAKALLQRSTEHGATFLPGGRCFANGSGDNGLRLAFSYVPTEQIEPGIAAIGAAMCDLEN